MTRGPACNIRGPACVQAGIWFEKNVPTSIFSMPRLHDSWPGLRAGRDVVEEANNDEFNSKAQDPSTLP